MNQLSPGPHDSQATGPDTTAGTATAPGGKAAAGNGPTHFGAANDNAAPGNAAKYDAVAGPFTIRDLTIFGSTLLMFVASLLPMFGARYNLWNLGNLFFLLLGIILPLVVVALFVARRLQPGSIIRVGSLSIDQFASVTASFAFPLFFLTLANSFNSSVLLGLVGAVGMLAGTVLAPHLPWLSADFRGRAETPAHVVAREAAVPSRKPTEPKTAKEPKAPKPSAATFTPGAAAAPGFQGPGYQAPGYQPPTAGTADASSAGNAAPATGASPFAPPATYGTAASPATGSPAVVHSADAAPQAPVAGTSPAVPSSQQGDVAKGAGSETGKAPASAPEPATTHNATTPPATQQPTAQQTAPAQQAAERPWAATMATPVVSGDTRKVSDSIGATVDPASRPDESDAPAYEAFWFAVAQPRTAYDEQTGAPSFVVEPGGWVLALEDRGHEFLVQDTDGTVGVLRDLSNIERG